LTDPEAIRAAVRGVDKLLLLNAVVADELTHFASKVAAENALHEFGVPYTILRPAYFFQNDLSLKPLLHQMGIYPMPIGTVGISAIDSRDLAEAAAVPLADAGHEGQTYDLVSSSQISGPVNAALWSKALDKQINYTGHDFDAWEKQMSTQLPAWMACDMRTMLEGYVERGFASAEADVSRVTKLLSHTPRTYEAFVQEVTAAWSKSE
jgi:uncharacterized protein YbjT (DUF2867 family)